MRRLVIPPSIVLTALVLTAGVPAWQADQPPPRRSFVSAQGQSVGALVPPATQIPLNLFQVPDGFEITLWAASPDRKSTRLNSSHLVISYAVFCLKKKTAKADHL